MKPTRLRGVAALVVAIVLTIGVICLVNGWRRVGRPFPGFLVAKNHIVVSIGRSSWAVRQAGEMLFAKVIGIADRPIESAAAIERAVAGLPIGTPVTYRFRKRADVFTATVPVQRFGVGDFCALYVTYFVVGLCFALAGCWAVYRAPHPVPAVTAFFIACQTIAVVLLTGGDVYGPYWFNSVYFTAHCLAPAALLHFTVTYPEPVGLRRWRWTALALLYLGSLAVAVVLNLVADDPSLFLPLIYTVYLVLANVLLLYLGRLVIALWSITDPALRRSVRLALAAVLLSASAPGVIFVIYPVMKGPISPFLLVAPLTIFPLVTASAVRDAARVRLDAPAPSVRLRLSLLFLGAVETAFIAGIAVFWLNSGWKQLFDDVSLNLRQQALTERFLSGVATATPEELTGIDALLLSAPERALVAAASAALARHDPAAAIIAIGQLDGRYRAAALELDVRREWLSRLDATVVFSLLVLGVIQAVGFMLAVRRWLIRPIDRLARATSVIATGDLSHRVRIDSAREFATLAEAINTMAASLAQIQGRVAAEREARHEAAAGARDTERRRLARELHDGALQDLSAVKLRIESVMKRMPAAELQPAIAGLIEVIVTLRRIVDDLAAHDLARGTLPDAIASYAQVMAQGRQIALHLVLAPDVEVADWASRDVYRIAQEGIANAVRHAAPAHLAVRLQREATQTVLEISDDGAGFDLSSVTLGTGIASMRERAAAIGARLDIRTAAGKGTTLRLTLPASPA